VGGVCNANEGEEDRVYVIGRETVYMLLVGKPEGKKPPGRLRVWLVNNIKKDLLDRVVWCKLDLSGSE
jgi:hypothetical protein